MKIMVMSTKGGVGKTSIAGGLASVAALRRDQRTLYIEADEQLSAHYFLQHVHEVDNAFVDAGDLAAAVRQGSRKHDVCIYDVPPWHRYMDYYLDAAEAADFTLVPYAPDETSMDSVAALLRGLRGRAPGRHAAVLNRINASSFSYPKEQAFLETMRDAGVPVLSSTIKAREVWSTLKGMGAKSLVHHGPNGLARREIEKVYAEIEDLTGRAN